MWRHESVLLPFMLCSSCPVCHQYFHHTKHLSHSFPVYKIEFVQNCISLSDQALPDLHTLFLKSCLLLFFPFLSLSLLNFCCFSLIYLSQDLNTSGIFLYIPRGKSVRPGTYFTKAIFPTGFRYHLCHVKCFL